MKPTACVIGDMDMIRPLGVAGIRCIAAGPTGPETRWSRYACGSVSLPDLWTDPQGTVDRLIEFARSQSAKPVLFYQKDPAVLTISRYRAALSPWFHFVVPDADLVEDLVYKDRFQVRAQDLGLPVPEAIIATPGADAAPIDVLPFPVIVKPVLRNRPLETWRPIACGAKAILCPTGPELGRLWDRPEVQGFPLTVQQYVPGDESHLVSYHAFIEDGGSVVGEFCGRKTRTLPSAFGLSTAVEIADLPRVRSTGLEVLRSLGFTGVAKVDFKEAPNGDLYVLEVNPRFSLWHHPGAAAGVNLPEAVYYYLTEGRSDDLPPATSGVRWVQVWGDRRAARAAGVSLSEWLRFVATAETRRAFHLTDPGAALGALAFGAMQKSGLAARS